MSVVAYQFANLVTKYILLPPYSRIRVIGIENVPLQGPLVIASNHLNDADPGVIATNFPRRVIYLAKIELFRIPLLGSFMKAYGALPVRRNEADLAALRLAAAALEEGKVICIFPEGTRSAGEARMREAWPGAALIALRSNAPVLPIAITGSQYLSLPKMFLRPFRRYKVEMKIGKPFLLPQPKRINSEAAKEGTRVIMEHIAALLPPSYRGYYGTEETSKEEPATNG
ncbi:MAG TPA: lysophospholipid acyltransferase family protein [Dehalococcoidia bacterium]|nr:lysophospholipid acyltransferase family protein [Dehalococcoidia bacterium]